jgi:hypothetical protein
MADFYPVLARAVSGLANNDAQARRDLYARARAIVGEQLRRGDRNAAVDVLREQAALETAIGRIEAEARSGQAPMNGKAAVARASGRRTVAPLEQRAANTARSLSKILQAVQSHEADTASALPPWPKSKSVLRSPLPAIEQKEPAATAHRHGRTPPSGLGQAPNSVGSMLFALTYVVAALAFAGVTYIRCTVWVYQGVIGYPILFGVMAVTLGLFIVPPVAIFRKTSSRPTMDAVWRFIYARSRGLL